MGHTAGSLKGAVAALVNIPIANNISTGFFPIGLGYVAAALAAAEAEVLVVDPQGEQLSEKETLTRLAGWIHDWDVRFFGLSSMITGYEYAKGIARGIKELRPDATVFIGGSIAAATELLLRSSQVDIVCQGEGEESAVDLLKTLAAGGDPSAVPGIAFRKNGETHFTTPRERIQDLGRLAFPAWDKFPVEYYITTPKIVQGVARGMSLASTRGCPYKCGFCYRSFGRIPKTRPAQDVATELETVVEKYNVHHFEFVDELFTQNPAMVKELCDEIRRRDLNITWRCLARVNPLEKETLAAMREAGCRWVGFGIESGSQEILNAMGKGVKVDHVRRAIGLAREAGLEVSGTFIIGYPGETEETVAETIRFCKEMELANRPFFPVPYPGTLLYEKLRAEGRVQDEEKFIERICGNATELLINISGMTDEKLIELRNGFVDELGQFFPVLVHPTAVKAEAQNTIPPQVIDKPYTRQRDPRVQALVAADVQRGVQVIAAGLPGCMSIILTGGFGRGEGGVIVEGNEITPVNDYDFVAVVEKPPSPDDLRELRQMAARDSAIDHVDILTINLDALAALPPYQFNYDMKHGGRVVWGEDSLAMIPEYQPGEIPLDSCTLVLVNRVICLLECYSEDYEKRDLTEHEGFYLANQTAKAVLATVEALLIRAGKYHHSYAERAAIFQREFPGQDDLVGWATDFKLFPRRRPEGDLVRLWRRSLDWYFTVLASFPRIFAYDSGSEASPREARAVLLQELLSGQNNLHPIEKVEMYLLAYRVAGFWQRGRFLKKARRALGEITGVGQGRVGWEEVRRETVKLWHDTLG